MIKHRLLISCVAAVLCTLAACSQSGQPAQGAKDAGQGTSSSFIAGEVQKGIAEARQKLLTENIDINDVHVGNDHHHDNPNLPRAQITPQGDLLLAGKKVDATPAQRALLRDYRQQVIQIAEAGMDIGASGADLGVSAAREAIFGALAGKSDKEIEASIKPQTDRIQAAAMQLCKRLPDLLASQQKLAAAMPAFKPYATMTQQDVDDCGKDIDRNGKKGFAVFSDDANQAQVEPSTRDRIRAGIRAGVQTAAQKAGLASRGTPDASPPASASSTN
ncbi:MAG: hypothetical protein OJF55_000292 [Rhodanobacteraceae bacterium]|jgi:hypothetical protein|nr:MAG: hypothetical protein OJF55_000292 [Rhodanobacteraceae bacterium]